MSCFLVKCRKMCTWTQIFSLLFCFIVIVKAFEWSTDSVKRPFLDRRSIAGIWRLTPAPTLNRPMKEFTVYPKQQKQSIVSDFGFLLLLKEDGSFQKYAAVDNSGNDKDRKNTVDLSKSWADFVAKEIKKRGEKRDGHLLDFVKGVWDYIDGKLILAADRPDVNRQKSYDEPRSRTVLSKKESKDTILEGEVVAIYQKRLLDNPVVEQLNVDEGRNGKDGPKLATSDCDPSTFSTYISNDSLDAHLTVPVGSIKIGKFFYPKTHPSFFEQPMYKPENQGTFALRQILGQLNTGQNKETKNVEKFQRSDFYNKTFLLTTNPIGPRIQKKSLRRKISYNSYTSGTPATNEDAESAHIRNIRVMQVKFYANNTFSTVGGLGSDVILRGKYDVIGEAKDHLWFQVVRFGFGRSVSGSVYSEGRMLSQDDAKAYWGKITLCNDNSIGTQKDTNVIVNECRHLEVTGSVMDGWGLEPIPVARFIMRESSDTDFELDEDDDIDENDNDIDNSLDYHLDMKIESSMDDDGISWSSFQDGNATFQ